MSQEPVFDPLPEPTLPELDRPWNTVAAGVGGTGVLTVTSLIAMAAHIEGKDVPRSIKRASLKFGAVVSHVRVATTQQEINAVRIPAGEADLFIGCDLVVSTGDEAMGKVAHGRTHALVNDHQQPTADFIRDPDAHFPAASMRESLTRSGRSPRVRSRHRHRAAAHRQCHRHKSFPSRTCLAARLGAGQSTSIGSSYRAKCGGGRFQQASVPSGSPVRSPTRNPVKSMLPKNRHNRFGPLPERAHRGPSTSADGLSICSVRRPLPRASRGNTSNRHNARCARRFDAHRRNTTFQTDGLQG